MEGDIEKGLAIAGIIILLFLAAVVRLRGAFLDVIPPSLTAWRRNFGISVVPPVTGTPLHLAPLRGRELPTHQDHPHRLHHSPSITSIAYPPPAYGSHIAERQYIGPVHGSSTTGNSRGMSVVVVPTSLPPSYSVNPGENN